MRRDFGAVAEKPCLGAVAVTGLFWSPFVEIVSGGCGVAFALWSIGRRREGKPMHMDAAKADIGLLVFGALLVLTGSVRMLQL